ncbi:MAG: hypothetical protein JXR07_05875 [Reichenbachiella sp.]
MKKLVYLFVAVLISNLESSALTVAKIFNDHAIIQRDVYVPVWGWTDPGERITLTFMKKSYRTKADAEGRWEVSISPTKYGGPYQIAISDKNEKIEFKDIYVGDVWICSGQSNMEFHLSGTLDGEEEIKNADDLLIRQFRIPQSSADFPADDLADGTWKVGSPEYVASFSAVGYYFAKYVREEFPDVPIGLINNSWGGSKIEPFMRAKSFGKNQNEINKEIDTKLQAIRLKSLEMLNYLDEVPEVDKGMFDGDPVWANNDLDDSDWFKMELPSAWEKAGLPNLDGIVWFRKSFNVIDLVKGDSSLLSIGRIDDEAEIWVNGNRIDNLFNRSYQWSDLREYKLSNELFLKGKNVVTVRVTDTGGGGGMGGNVGELYVQSSAERIDLSGTWNYKIGKAFLNFLYGPRQMPTTIYNKMVHPVSDYKIKGFLWYQGESNTGSITEAQNYENLFKTMIEQWRSDWGDDNLPFYFVQLASFLSEVEVPTDHSWAHLRQSQFKALELANTGMASALDIGEANDIHPRNKQEVGRRLSLMALNGTYGKSEIRYKNPSYKSHEIKGEKVLVKFQDVGNGLKVDNKYGYINGFAIAGSDGKYRWAKAKIVDGAVSVWHPDIKNPVGIQYGWVANALDANLFSNDNLPVVPFKIDNK